MSILRGLARVGSESPRTLILGSFPSVASLERGEYYGHDRNHFWILLGSILGFDPRAPYAERISRLEASGMAIWDLIASCEREGSLDKDIREETSNPIADYLESTSTIVRIALNGGKAAAAFSGIFPALGFDFEIGKTTSWAPSPDAGTPLDRKRRILVARLPSSSPVPTKRYRTASDKLPIWSVFLS